MLESVLLGPSDAGPGFALATNTRPVQSPSQASGCGASLVSLTNEQNTHDVVAYGYADLGKPQGIGGVQSEIDRFHDAQVARADLAEQVRLARACTTFTLTQPNMPTVTITLAEQPRRDGQTDIVIERVTLPTGPSHTLYQTFATSTAGELGLQVSVTAPQRSIAEAKRLLRLLTTRAARLSH